MYEFSYLIIKINYLVSLGVSLASVTVALSFNNYLKPQVVTTTGLEPVISCVTGRHDNQLHYAAINL